MYEPYAGLPAHNVREAFTGLHGYASWPVRVAATLIDLVALILGLVLCMVLVAGTGDFAFWVLACFAAVFLYDPLCHYLWGQTIGKRLVGIRILSADGGTIGFAQALWRHAAKLLLGIIPIVGLLDVLMPLVHSRKQTMHDAAACTIVVYAD